MKLKEYLETRKISKNIFKVIVLTVFVLSLNSLSYAYFTSTIEGEGKEIVLSTSDISIKFEDNEAIKKTGLTPGERIIKKFSVTNNSEGKVEYKINWEYLINNFVNREYLTYSLTSTNGGGTLTEVQLPDSEEHINIISSVTINPGVTQEYTMTINYKNSSSINQDADKNKSLIGKLEITDMSGNSILPETSTGSSESPIESEQNLYGLKIKDLVDVLYPVGMVVEFGKDINPNEIESLVGTKWERYGEGKVSIGYSSSDTSFNSIGKTGGSKSINLAHSHTVNSHTHTTKDHTLTVDEMPNHGYHLFKSFADAAGNGTARRFLNSSYLGTSGSTGRGWTIWNANESYPAGQNLGGSAAHNHGETSASSPGTTSELSTSQSVLNPYIVSAKWIRVS